MTNNEIVLGFDDSRDDKLRINLNKIIEVPNCLLLTLSGYIDTYNSNLFERRIQRAIEAGYIRLIFHCGGLNYVSSTGIGSFTVFLKTIKPRGGNLILLDTQANVYEVFQLLGFSKFFNFKHNMDDSIFFFLTEDDRPSVFPKAVFCPICNKKLRAFKPGRFKCSGCKSILAIDEIGQIMLG